MVQPNDAQPNGDTTVPGFHEQAVDSSVALLDGSSGLQNMAGKSRGPRAVWPYNTYLVSHPYRFIYCPIPKNANSSLKRWYVTTLGVTPEDPGWPTDFHGFCRERTLTEMADLDRGYFRFVFVRNPWSRLVSGYLQKFLRRWDYALSPARPIVEQHYRSRGLLPDYETSVSFRHFVEHVVATGDEVIDIHWRPQYLSLGGLRFDFVGRVENLQADFSAVVDRLGIKQRCLFEANRTSYGEEIAECVADWPGIKLRNLHHLPHYRWFYTDDLRDRVARRYACDIDLFGYTFE